MDDPNKAAASRIVAMAKEYVADPAKGYAAGYQPRRRYTQVREIGRPAERVPTNTEEQAWVEGIAEKDLKPDTWRLLSGFGGVYELQIF
jgi:hypothetical protein